MAEPAYMRMRHRSEFIPGPLTECGEENLWEIHEFSHEISGNEPDNLWAHSQWDTKHKVLKVVLEVGAFLPRLYAVDVGNCEYINRVEIFWRQYSEKQKKNHFYFKHTIYPVKITAITMLMPNVKDKHYEKYSLLVSIEFRYRYIEHLYSEGYLHTKAEWKYFFADESFEPIPEEYLSGRCLSHEALGKGHQGNAVFKRVLHFEYAQQTDFAYWYQYDSGQSGDCCRHAAGKIAKSS